MGLVGKILVAPPLETEPPRVDSVVLVTNEYNQYHIGLRLNNKSNMSVTELAAYSGYRLNIPGYVYSGGTHSLNSFSMLHSNEWSCENTIRINDFVSISSSNDVMKHFMAGYIPLHWRMFLGVNKWLPDQLEAEINGIKPYTHDTSWCVTSSTPEMVFETPHTELWDTALTATAEEFARKIWA